MSAAENPSRKQIVLDYVDAMNKGDFQRLKSLFSDDAAIYGVLGKGNVDFAMPIWKDLHEALSMHLEVCEIIEEGNVVAVRFRETGKSVQPFRGFPATGKTFELTAIEWFTVDNGRITSRYGVRDGSAQARQLGWAA
ncbi:ester cyclase [Gellertiella hungarica]|uniref:Steroid delta-isomerase-like uncharacterized protein n=1 Tax=Gellertiella hungarica TaxID=1572859 RepID=A0A7W6NKX8_9HYPH|nr:ester cyclase [Gellertiella hungarica]MBB4064762.1 steroid delta-isomerase-like uncharacterized protein [Gellertiella hungarica]